METADRKLDLTSFGVGVLSGLRLQHVSLLSDRDIPAFHGAFKAAYDVVFDKSELEPQFLMILDEILGTTSQVDEIMSHWLSTPYGVTRESPGPVIRLNRVEAEETHDLINALPGDADLWRRVADAFMKAYVGWI